MPTVMSRAAIIHTISLTTGALHISCAVAAESNRRSTTRLGGTTKRITITGNGITAIMVVIAFGSGDELKPAFSIRDAVPLRSLSEQELASFTPHSATV